MNIYYEYLIIKCIMDIVLTVFYNNFFTDNRTFMSFFIFHFSKHICNFPNAWIQYTWECTIHMSQRSFVHWTNITGSSKIIILSKIMNNMKCLDYESKATEDWVCSGMIRFKMPVVGRETKYKILYIIVISICFSSNTPYSPFLTVTRLKRWKVHNRPPHKQVPLLQAIDDVCNDITGDQCQAWICPVSVSCFASLDLVFLCSLIS